MMGTGTDAAREIEETKPSILYPKGQIRAAAKELIRTRNGSLSWSWPGVQGSWRRIVDDASALSKHGYNRTVAAALALDREYFRTRPRD